MILVHIYGIESALNQLWYFLRQIFPRSSSHACAFSTPVHFTTRSNLNTDASYASSRRRTNRGTRLESTSDLDLHLLSNMTSLSLPLAYSQSKLKLYMILKLQSLTMLFPAFNIPGVKEHAHFLKDVKDARRIRSRILECAPLLSWNRPQAEWLYLG